MLSGIYDRSASLIFGITLPVRALGLIARKPVLFVWAAIPIAISLGLSIWGTTWVKHRLLTAGTAWLASQGLAPDSFASQAAVVFLKIALFVVAAIAFSVVAGIVAAPFNDFLSEAAEPHCEPPPPALPVEASSFRGRVRAVRLDIAKTLAVGVIQLALIVVGLLAFWIPGLNLIPLFLAFWLLSFQFISYPQTRRGEDFSTSIRFLGRHLFATFGFGAAIGTLFSIPILSAFVLPVAVVGGTLLFARSQDSNPSRFKLR